jgi:hypothetical protein
MQRRLRNKGATIMVHAHQTAPTRFVEANGVRFAYRRFGRLDRLPLVFNQHFTGTMDHWDPAVTDGFAKDRDVILFDNAGISSSSGEVPTSIEEMAANAVAFISAYDNHRNLGQSDFDNDHATAALRTTISSDSGSNERPAYTMVRGLRLRRQNSRREGYELRMRHSQNLSGLRLPRHQSLAQAAELA